MRVQGEITAAVTLEEFKRSRHVVGDDSDDDAVFEVLLAAAQDVVETGTNRPLTPRTVEIQCRARGGRRWWFPCAPVVSVEKIEWQESGAWVELDSSGAWVEQGHDQPQLVFPAGFWAGVADGAPVRVTASVGYADPDPKARELAQAICLIAADWFEAGINPDRDKHTVVSFGCRILMRKNRYLRPCEWAAV